MKPFVSKQDSLVLPARFSQPHSPYWINAAFLWLTGEELITVKRLVEDVICPYQQALADVYSELLCNGVVYFKIAL